MRLLVANLQEFEPGIDGEQIANILWLAQHITIAPPSELPAPVAESVKIRTERSAANMDLDTTGLGETPALPESASPSTASVYTSESVESAESGPRLPFRAAATRALRKPIELERALRPLMRKVPRNRATDSMKSPQRSGWLKPHCLLRPHCQRLWW